MMKLGYKGTVAAAALLVAGLPAHADLITNGGFEDPALADGTWDLFDAVDGWYVIGDSSIEIQNNVAGTPYEGEQFVELDSDRQSTIGQDVATEAGAEYVLSFAFAARPNTNIAEDNFMRVEWDGSEIFAQAAPDFTPNWTVFSFHVTASSDTTTVTFGDLSSNSRETYGVYLDAVSLVSKVPEPGTLGLLGLGLFGLGMSRRLRR